MASTQIYANEGSPIYKGKIGQSSRELRPRQWASVTALRNKTPIAIYIQLTIQVQNEVMFSLVSESVAKSDYKFHEYKKGKAKIGFYEPLNKFVICSSFESAKENYADHKLITLCSLAEDSQQQKIQNEASLPQNSLNDSERIKQEVDGVYFGVEANLRQDSTSPKSKGSNIVIPGIFGSTSMSPNSPHSHRARGNSVASSGVDKQIDNGPFYNEITDKITVYQMNK